MIKKSTLPLFLFFLALTSLITTASAAITLTQPENIYNLGDQLSLTAKGLKGTGSGNFNIHLVCGNQTTTLVKIPASSFDTEEETEYSFYKRLEPKDLEITDTSTILGSCQVVAALGGEVASTKTFTITNEVIVTVTQDTTSYNPGEPVTLTAQVKKANGEQLTGYLYSTNGTPFEIEIENGQGEKTFVVPDSAAAGKYTLHLTAYDELEGVTLNSGTTDISYLVNQIPTSIIISLSDTYVDPEESVFTVGSEVLDQSGKNIEGTVELLFTSVESGESFESTVQTGSFVDVPFSLNSTPGTWVVTATYNEIDDAAEFDVAIVKKLIYTIEEGVLHVTNIGNALYDESLTVKIGEQEMELTDLNINVGESRRFKLKAPQGEYTVIVEDGTPNPFSQTAFLTGKVISIQDVKENGFFSWTIVWILVIIILLGLVALFFLRSRHTKATGLSAPKSRVLPVISPRKEKHTPLHEKKSFFNKKKAPLTQQSTKKSSSDMVDLTHNKMGSAESSIVLKGEKYPSAVAVIRIKNFATLSEHTISELRAIIDNTKPMKGLIDWKGEHVFIVFSPLFTRTYNNEHLAAKTASQILRELKEYNRKFNEKIDFNIGIHSGFLVANKEGGKLKYTSIGNTISFAKRVSDSGEGTILVSEEVHKKMLRELKTTKSGEIANRPIYEVQEIKNREANHAKLQDLLKRMDKPDNSNKQKKPEENTKQE